MLIFKEDDVFKERPYERHWLQIGKFSKRTKGILIAGISCRRPNKMRLSTTGKSSKGKDNVERTKIQNG